jgi:uncharacterized protein (TIGR03437 family)
LGVYAISIPYGIKSVATGEITQTGSTLSGQFTLTGSPCATTASASGSISGQNVTINLTEGNQIVMLNGVTLGGTAGGSYSTPSGGCTNGDFGSWSGSQIVTPTVPTITGVTSAADYSPGYTVEGYVSIFGSLLSDAVYSSSPPYPTKLGSTQVSLCSAPALTSACVPAEIAYASPGQLNVLVNQLPPNRPPGYSGQAPATYFFVTSGGVMSSGLVVAYNSPVAAFFAAGYDCFTDPNPLQDFSDVDKNCGLSPVRLTANQVRRAVVTDLNGAIIWSGNPARVGAYYTIWATGLGLNPPLINASFDVTVNAGQYATAIGIPVHVTYTGEVPQFPGLYQINFQLATGVATPNGSIPTCGSNLEVLFYVAGSTGVWLPIAIKTGDVPCTP